MRWTLVNATGFGLLSGFVLLYYFMIYFQMQGLLALTIFFAGAALLFFGLAVEMKRIKHRKYSLERELEIIAASLIGGLITFSLSLFNFGFGALGPVIAAGIVGLAGFELLKKFKAIELSLPLYAGAFVGMSSPLIFSIHSIALASMVTGIIYIIAHELYSGTGGLLGTMAFTSTTITRRFFGG